jgi:hypothetical protein
MFLHQNHGAGGGNGSVMVGMFVCLCLAIKKPSEREYFVPARIDLAVKLLRKSGIPLPLAAMWRSFGDRYLAISNIRSAKYLRKICVSQNIRSSSDISSKYINLKLTISCFHHLASRSSRVSCDSQESPAIHI